MHVRIINFGTNWWAMHSRNLDDPFCFRRSRRVVQLGGTQVRPQVATVLGVSRSDPVQPEQRFSAGASAAVHGEDIPVQRSKPFGRSHAPSICPPVR